MRNFITYFCIAFTIFIFILCFIGFALFPELFMPTWKYQLKRDIKRGDPEAIEYYINHYVNKEIKLFDETITIKE